MATKILAKSRPQEMMEMWNLLPLLRSAMMERLRSRPIVTGRVVRQTENFET